MWRRCLLGFLYICTMVGYPSGVDRVYCGLRIWGYVGVIYIYHGLFGDVFRVFMFMFIICVLYIMKTLIGGDILDITRSKLRYLQTHTPEISPDTSDDITGPVVINDANKRKLRSIIAKFINDELQKYWRELSAIEAKFDGDSITHLRKLESKVQVLSNLALTDQDKSRLSRFQENIKDDIDFVSDRLDMKPISKPGVGFSVKPTARLDAIKPTARLDAMSISPRLDAMSSARHKRNTVRLPPIGNNKGGRRRRKRVTVKRRRRR